MQSYTHFTHEQRESIAEKLREHKSIRCISREMGRSPSSISRELKRNSTQAGEYSPWGGTSQYLLRRRNCRRIPRLESDKQLKEWIIARLGEYWPPETIAAVWKKNHPEAKLSHSTIYRALGENRLSGRSAKTHLRRRGKRRYGQRSKYSTIQPEHLIRDRPEEANSRLRIGDWEGDTLSGGAKKGGLFTCVDRKSRYLLASRLMTHSAQDMKDAMLKVLRAQPRHTLTLDNGSEFAKFKQTEQELQTTIYFADPHSPWQRGSNENTNGLLRFFFPKGTDFTRLSDEQIDLAVFLLNSRPRKCLGWLSPREVFFGKCCI